MSRRRSKNKKRGSQVVQDSSRRAVEHDPYDEEPSWKASQIDDAIQAEFDEYDPELDDPFGDVPTFGGHSLMRLSYRDLDDWS